MTEKVQIAIYVAPSTISEARRLRWERGEKITDQFEKAWRRVYGKTP